jgi:hypothetical protein
MRFSYLDLIKYPTVKIMAKMKVTPPTTRHTIPSVSFFPPNQPVVDNTSFLLALAL